jgi:hypothetical protein
MHKPFKQFYLLLYRRIFNNNLSKASIHDIHYLNYVKHSELNNCTFFWQKSIIQNLPMGTLILFEPLIHQY